MTHATSLVRVANSRAADLMTRAWLVLILCAFAFALPGHAASLTPVKAAALPALPSDEALVGIAVVVDTPIAIQREAVWMLDPGHTAWSRAQWPEGAASSVVGVFGDGLRAYALTGAGAGEVTAVEQIQIVNGELRRTALPFLPAAMREARGTLLGQTLFVSGLVGSSPRLLQLPLDAVRPQWKEVTGWPADAPATTLVGQTGAIFATVADGDTLWRWSADKGWTARGTVPGMILPGSGRPIG